MSEVPVEDHGLRYRYDVRSDGKRSTFATWQDDQPRVQPDPRRPPPATADDAPGDVFALPLRLRWWDFSTVPGGPAGVGPQGGESDGGGGGGGP